MRSKTNTNLLPEYFEIPFKVPNGDLVICLRAEHVPAAERDVIGIFGMPIEGLPQLLAKGYQPMFSTFTTYLDDQIVKVKLFFRKSKHLTRPKAGVKNRKRNKARTYEILPMKFNVGNFANSILSED